jgi:HSP20 family protein
MRRTRTVIRTTLFWQVAGSFTEPTWRPAADVYRTRDGWLVKFELPGVRPEDLVLRVGGAGLTVQGVRRDCCLSESDCRHQSLEIAYGRFERHVPLPVSLEQAHITSEYQAGMLLVHVRTEESE